MALNIEAGEPYAMPGYSTMPRQAEPPPHIALAAFHDICDAALVGQAILSLEGRFLRANPAFCQMTGHDSDELSETNLFSLAHPEDGEICRINVQLLLAGRIPHAQMEKRFIRKDRGVACVRESLSLLKDAAGEPAYMLATIEDIGAYKQSELELRRQARLHEAVARLGQVALAGSNLSYFMETAVRTVVETLRAEYCKLLELRGDGGFMLRAGAGWHEGLIGHTAVDEGEQAQAAYTLGLGQPIVVEDLPRETRFRRPQLPLDRHVVSSMSVAVPGRQRPYGVLAVDASTRRIFTRDEISFVQAVAGLLAAAVEVRRREDMMRGRDEALQGLFASCPDVFILAEPAGRVRLINAAVFDVLGYAPRELFEANHFELVHPDDLPPLLRAIAASEKHERKTGRGRYRYCHADGRWVVLDCRWRLICDGSGQPSSLVMVSRGAA